MSNDIQKKLSTATKDEPDSITTSCASVAKLGVGSKGNVRIQTSAPTLDLLRFFRWFVPRNQRENIDIIISDLKEDIQDMRKEQKSWAFIQMLVTWHSVRAIGAHALYSAAKIAEKLNPIASIFEKKSDL